METSEQPEPTGWVNTSSLTVIDVTGSQAGAFLQGQSCNDMDAVSATQAQLTGYCNPKGRLLALYTVYAHADGFRILLPRELQEGFLKRLRMFVMRDDVVFTERNDLAVSGYIGTPGSDWPDQPLQVQSDGDEDRLRWFDTRFGPDSGITSVPRYLRVSSTVSEPALPFETWQLGDINAGIPVVRDATREAFVPQMVNLEQVGGLSFKKGCYPGQEIVARMQYLGKLKRHMQRYRLELESADAADAIVAGTALLADKPDGGDPVESGQVVEAAGDGAGGVVLLAVVRIDAEPASLTVAGHRLTVQTLPYDLQSDA